MQKGEALLATSTRERAMEEFQKAIDITPDIAHKFMVSLREKNVRYVVAPYEADAQMAYLSRKGYVDAVITDDSDLLAFGCQRVFFKMDKTGQGYEISRDNFPKCTKIRLRNWTSESTSRLYCFCLSWYFNCVRKQKKKKNSLRCAFSLVATTSTRSMASVWSRPTRSSTAARSAQRRMYVDFNCRL